MGSKIDKFYNSILLLVDLLRFLFDQAKELEVEFILRLVYLRNIIGSQVKCHTFKSRVKFYIVISYKQFIIFGWYDKLASYSVICIAWNNDNLDEEYHFDFWLSDAAYILYCSYSIIIHQAAKFNGSMIHLKIFFT